MPPRTYPLHAWLEHVEHALYQYEGPERLAVCLAVHAAAKKRPDVPRVYVPRELQSPADAHQMLAFCLLSNPLALRQYTYEALDVLGLSALRQEWAAHECDALLQVVGDILYRGWGAGSIHYEMARFTPATAEDISLVCSITHSPFEEILRTRRTAMQTWCKTHETALRAINAPLSAPVFARCYHAKLEASWQALWQDAAIYLPRTAQERAVEALQIPEDNG